MMKARPFILIDGIYTPCASAQATHLELRLPGPLPNRILPIMIGGTRRGTHNWTWNGSTDFPTVKPSVLTRGRDEHGDHTCHSLINEGKVQFLSDCSHEFADQTLDLLDVD